MRRIFATPTTANVELTEICNVKCTHCYNFWRDESMGQVSVDHQQLVRTFDALSEAGIFHVVLTGGEPFAKFKTLLAALDLAAERKMSVSVNSNLMLATDDRLQQLAGKGVDHILTSLPSTDPATTDAIMHKLGAFEKIMDGIRAAVRNGVRVSVNMVITRATKDQVYDAGRLVKEMGAQTLFVTRAVPPTYSGGEDLGDYTLSPDETKHALDEAIRAKQDFGIMIGSLVSYPLCFLEDLERYADFVGRGCPAQSGHRMSINATGDIHACVHEEEAYGNIKDRPIKDVFSGEMRKWHNGSLHYSGCEGCPYDNICDSGCRMSALGFYGDHRAKDPLWVGPHVFKNVYSPVPDDEFLRRAREGMALYPATSLRFRREDGFYLINIRWGNTITVNTELGEFLERRLTSGAAFQISDLDPSSTDLIENLFYKGAIVAPDFDCSDKIERKGLGLNVEALPAALPKTGTG